MIHIRIGDGEAEISGAAKHLRSLSVRIRELAEPNSSGKLIVKASILVDPAPYVRCAGHLQVLVREGRVQVSELEGAVLEVAGSREKLANFSSWFDLPSGDPGYHTHYDSVGNADVAASSMALVICAPDG